MLDDPFGIKVVVGGAVELAKARWLPVLTAKGATRAELIKARGEFEVRKLENQLKVIEIAEEKLRVKGLASAPLSEEVLYNVLEECGRTSSEKVQELWSNLLVTSSGANVSDHRILTYVGILRQLSHHDAVVITEAVKLIPVETKNLWINSYWLDYQFVDYPNKLGRIYYTFNRHDEGNVESDSYSFLDSSDAGDFMFSLMNLERYGLIARSKRSFLKNECEQFNFTSIGTGFLNAIGVLPSSGIWFMDIEYFESMNPYL